MMPIEILNITSLTSYPYSLLSLLSWPDDNTSSNWSSAENDTNATDGAPAGPPAPPYTVWQQVLVTIALMVMCCGTVLGNTLVCLAVTLVRRLRTPSNLLIVSLAVSDLLVGLLVMPFAISYEILGAWVLGPTMCSVWTSLDVLLCTASILNLCVISVDRYLVITRPFQYAIKRNPRRMALMIASVWLASGLISIPPLFGWQTEQKDYMCEYSQELGYQIYATFGAFYLPLSVMLFVYIRIWRVSSRLAKSERKSSNIGSLERRDDNMTQRPSKSSKGSMDSQILPNGSMRHGSNDRGDTDEATMEMLPKPQLETRRLTLRSLLSRHCRPHPVAKESKATKTLGVIMGCFTLCWLPFFIVALLRPFCGVACDIPNWLFSILLWLGYANSTLNPMIYARFNRDFRTPFKEIICFRCLDINMRLNTESYHDMYGADPSVRDSLRVPKNTIVRYESQGQTLVRLGNGSTAASEGESKI